MAGTRQIIHVDMDAFYASVEQLDNPELVGKPVMVGGDPKARGVVSAACYEARRCGVHSAMPMAKAVRLCPDAIILPVRMERYVEVSQEIYDIFERYSPLVERVCIDEAFLDVTGSTKLFGSGREIGRAIKKTIKEELKLTASVGVAPSKFLAKLASDLEKPDGLVVITERNKQEILDPLPVCRIWGVGKVTEQALASYGIRTIAQLGKTPLKRLRAIVGNCADVLLELAWGVDESQVQPSRGAKRLSSEKTFAKDVHHVEILVGVLLEQVEEVAQRLRAENLRAKTIMLKLRSGDFRTITRSHTLGEATDVTQRLWQAARHIFQKCQSDLEGPVRLIGFAVCGLLRGDRVQRRLFIDPQEERLRRLDKAVDKIRGRYGKDALRRGC